MNYKIVELGKLGKLGKIGKIGNKNKRPLIFYFSFMDFDKDN